MSATLLHLQRLLLFLLIEQVNDTWQKEIKRLRLKQATRLFFLLFIDIEQKRGSYSPHRCFSSLFLTPPTPPPPFSVCYGNSLTPFFSPHRHAPSISLRFILTHCVYY
jgi:hypothetical protein